MENLIDYLVKLREGKARLIKVTQDFVQKISENGPWMVEKVVEFHVGNYVLLQYPNRSPNKLAGTFIDVL